MYAGRYDFAFEVYLTSKLKKTDGAALAFTVDGKLVVGVSVDDPFGKREPEQRARKLLKKLLLEFDCHQGLIATEEGPLHEGLFHSKDTVPCLVYYWSGKASK